MRDLEVRFGQAEVHIEDNYREEPESHKIGGIYGFLTPTVNAAKKPGEWQTVDITDRLTDGVRRGSAARWDQLSRSITAICRERRRLAPVRLDDLRRLHQELLMKAQKQAEQSRS